MHASQIDPAVRAAVAEPEHRARVRGSSRRWDRSCRRCSSAPAAGTSRGPRPRASVRRAAPPDRGPRARRCRGDAVVARRLVVGRRRRAVKIDARGPCRSPLDEVVADPLLAQDARACVPGRAAPRTRSRERQRCDLAIGGLAAEAVVVALQAHRAGRTGGPRPAARARRPRPRPAPTAPAAGATASGAPSTWSSAKVTGRPISAERRRIQSISRLGATTSSPAAPAARPRTRRGPARRARGRCRRARPRPRTCPAPARRPSRGARSCARSRSRARRPRCPRARCVGHRRDVVGRRRLVARAALAHHVGAHGAVRHLRADVERAAARARARRGTRGSSPSPSGCPRRARRRGCPRRPPSARSGGSRASPGRAGAKPTPQLPMTTRGDAVLARGREHADPR